MVCSCAYILGFCSDNFLLQFFFFFFFFLAILVIFQHHKTTVCTLCAKLLLLNFTNLHETLQAYFSWSKVVHITWILHGYFYCFFALQT